MAERGQGKRIRKKEKEVRSKVQAPVYLSQEARGDRYVQTTEDRVNPYAYYKSTGLVEPIEGLEELNIRQKFDPTSNNKAAQNFRLTEIAPERIEQLGKSIKYQEKAFLGHQLASWAVDNEKPGNIFFLYF